MKKIIFLLVISVPLFGQNVDYNKIILPYNTESPEFAEKLVQLAWRNHPTNEIYRREVNIADYEVKQSNVQWLENIRVTGNINEFVLNPERDIAGRAAFFPRYNVSASISLGQFFNIPYNTRKAKETLMIRQANVNAQKLAIRNQVMKAYNEYVLREKIYKIQSQLLLDNETSHKMIEQRFRTGETNFETYAASLSNFSSLSISHLDAEKNFRNAKLDLEQFIGMRLEDVR